MENLGNESHVKISEFTVSINAKLPTMFVLFAGISGDVLLDNQVQKDWLVYPLEFKTDYTNK